MTTQKWEEKLNRWMDTEELDEALARELRILTSRRDRKSARNLEERFYKDLEFGTSGLRGLLGAGTNRLNVHTVRKIIQGICDYIIEDINAFDNDEPADRDSGIPSKSIPSVAIAYDSRINSRLFAECAAEVLAANGIKAYMYDEIVPVAALSFAIRKLGCPVGVMMTASHNPAEYNGIKVYNASGCQVMPHEQEKMYRRISALDEFADVSYLNFEKARNTSYFEIIGDEVIEEYIDCVVSEKAYPASIAGENGAECMSSEASAEKAAFGNLKVLYTPLNGGGLRPAREMMKKIGIEKVDIVKSQEKPDGSFPTCPYPNPETDEAFSEALEIARTTRPDIIIATDPDCDRLGVVAKLDNGMYRKFNDNEIGIIMLDYIIRARRSHGISATARADAENGNTGKTKPLPAKAVAARSITSSALVDIIARENGVEMKVIPNGSNYIGEAINELERAGREADFIFAFEESIEYITGSHARDEDGVLGALHILSAAAHAKSEGKTLQDILDDIYKKYGYFENDSASIAFHGIEGLARRDEIMAGLRNGITENKWNKIGGKKVEKARDYLTATDGFPPINAIEFKLEDDAAVIIRPSGTEPKLKIYMHAKGVSSDDAKERCGTIEKDILGIINT